MHKAVKWFDEGNKLLLSDTASAKCVGLLDSVPQLIESTLVPLEFSKKDKGKLVSACEFVLEGLYAQNRSHEMKAVVTGCDQGQA